MDGAREDRHEPPGMTLADLVVLAIGCALAIAVPMPFSIRTTMASGDVYAYLEIVAEVLERGCVALAVVMFVRRVRYGGGSKAVEILLVFCAMPILAEWVQRAPLVRNTVWPGWLGWCYERTAELAWIAAFAVFARAHKRIPGWAGLALIGFAVFCFWSGASQTLALAGALAKAAGASEGGQDILLFSVFTFLVGLLYGVPAARAFLVRPGAGWIWADWLAALLVAPLLMVAAALGFNEVLNQINALPPSPPAVIPASLASLTVAIFVSVAFACRQLAQVRRRASVGFPG